jgi:hypothetical protein
VFDRLGMLFVVFVESLLWQSWDSRETLDVSGSHQQNLGTGLVIGSIWFRLGMRCAARSCCIASYLEDSFVLPSVLKAQERMLNPERLSRLKLPSSVS